MINSVLPALQRAALQGGVLILVGAIVWKLFVQRAVVGMLVNTRRIDADIVSVSNLERRVARIAASTALVLVLVWVLRLYVQLLEFRDPFVPVREDLALLIGGTFWGKVWIVQGGLLLVVAILFLRIARSRVDDSSRVSNEPDGPATPGTTWSLASAVTFSLVLTLSFSSHALSINGSRAVGVAADAIHLLGAGAWIGSLALILILGDRARSTRSLSLQAAQFRAFSPVALVAVPALIAGGTFLAWAHLTKMSDLWSTPYGRVLSVKILVAGLIMLLGFLNWRWGMPGIDDSQTRSAVTRRAVFEVTAALVVLALTAVLTGMPRPEVSG